MEVDIEYDIEVDLECDIVNLQQMMDQRLALLFKDTEEMKTQISALNKVVSDQDQAIGILTMELGAVYERVISK